MQEKEKVEALRGSSLGASLDPKQCQVLARVMEHRDLGNEEVLLAQGESDDRLHLVVSGTLAVTRDAGGGEWTTLAMLRPGDIAGGVGFVDGRPHSATLRAIGPTRVLGLQRGTLEGLLEAHPWIVYRVMQAIAQAVHTIVTRMNAQFVEMNNYITKQHGRY